MVKPIPTPSDLFGGRLPLDPSRAVGTYSAEPIAAGGSAIQRGAQELSGGAQALARGTERYAQGTEQLAQGAQRYAQGTQQYLQGNEQYARGMGQLGIGEQRLGQGMDQFVQDQQRFQFSTAHSQAMSQLVDLDTQFLNDTDYATRVQRYNEARDNIINSNAQNIASPFMRDRFVASMASSGAQQTYRQSEVAQRQYNSDTIAKSNEQGQWLIGKAVSTTDPIIRGNAIDAFNSNVDAMVANKVISPVQGILTKRKWAQDYARADALSRIDRGDFSVLDEIRNARPSEEPGNITDEIKKFEGYSPRAQWDYKQYSNGYGTRATSPTEVIDQNTADQRLKNEVGAASAFVDSVNPNLPAGVKAALTSLTFNAGEGWANAGLGKSIRNGDFETAKKQFVQYNQAGGQVNPGLANRRNQEVQWFDQPDKFSAGQPTTQEAGTTEELSAQSKQAQSIYSVLTPLQREEIRAQADRAAQAQLIQQQRQYNFEQHQREQVSQGEQDKIIKDTYSPNPSISAQSIANNPDLTPKDKMTMLRFVAAATKPEAPAEVSHQATMSILDSMRKPDGDPNKITNLDPIYNAYINGSINRTDFSFLRNEFQARQTPDGDNLQKSKAAFFKGVEAQIDKSNPLMGNIDSSGKENMYIFNWDVNKKIDEYTKAGKNPYDLFDPSKPDFMGRPEVLSRYQKTLDQSLSDQVRKLTPAPSAGTALPTTPSIAPRKEGETPDQYFKRTGLQ